MENQIKAMMDENIDFQKIAPWWRELMARKIAAQLRLHLTALRRGLAVSVFINVVLLAVVLYVIGGR